VLDKSTSLTAPPTTVTRTESKVPRALQKYLTLDDFEPAARRRIPKFLYGYISGGAETDAAMRESLASESERRVVFLSESIDAQRFSMKALEPELLGLLARKYRALNIDAPIR